MNINTLLRRIKLKIIKSYNPEIFWNDWASDFMQDSWQVRLHPQHEWMLEIIKNDKPHSILEVGCGFGRNIKFLIENGIDAKFITGSDISSKMLTMAKKYVNNKDVKFLKVNVAKLPYSDNQFDLLLSHGVFMHVKKNEIDKALSEARRVAKKMIIIEQNYGGNEYTFVHNYKRLLKDHGKIPEYVKDKKLGLDLIYFKK